MSVRGRRGAGLPAAVAVLLAAGLAACSSGSQNRPGQVLEMVRRQEQAGNVVAGGSAAAVPPKSTCTSPYPPQASYPKLPSVPSTPPPGSLEASIKQRGYLVVGVAGDTLLLGARTTLKDKDPAGFDIEIARAVGRAILGPNADIRFKVITASQRFAQVNLGVRKNGLTADDGVDLVARAVSMTCDRWAATTANGGSAFSAAYLQASQRVLVRQGVTSLEALVKARAADGGVRVCAPTGTSSLANIPRSAIPVPVAIHSDCLALWQEGRVDAITGDDVVLAGFKKQDPTAVIIGPALESTPYGLAIARSHPEFVQYVNAVMATPEFHNAWRAAYDQYLRPALPAEAQQDDMPRPDYSRPLP